MANTCQREKKIKNLTEDPRWRSILQDLIICLTEAREIREDLDKLEAHIEEIHEKVDSILAN